MENNELVESLIERNKDLEEALATILCNTLHKTFNDVMFKVGLMANIKLGLGDEKFKYYLELYS